MNCNIILSESIPSAAQQFGLALYNSLGASQELLAGQAGYLIDKNSIKLNCKYIYLFLFLFLSTSATEHAACSAPTSTTGVH